MLSARESEDEMTRVDEVGEGIYRVGTWWPEYGIIVNQFVIADERPTLVHTGTFPAYEAVRNAVAQVIDPKKLAYVVSPTSRPTSAAAWAASSPTRRRRCWCAARSAPASTSRAGTTVGRSRACATATSSN